MDTNKFVRTEILKKHLHNDTNSDGITNTLFNYHSAMEEYAQKINEKKNEQIEALKKGVEWGLKIQDKYANDDPYEDEAAKHYKQLLSDLEGINKSVCLIECGGEAGPCICKEENQDGR